MSYKIHLIASARPNFMKIAPLYHALNKEFWAEPTIVHTGQHYDQNMSDSFFKDLDLPEPDIHLGVGSGTHAEQTGLVMLAYEKVLLNTTPDQVIVVGDVNSTRAATLAAVKLGVKVAHLEAGLRSFDRTMPEEINRLVTDTLADILWTPSADADENLITEGINPQKIHRVGNIMIDSLEMLRGRIEQLSIYEEFGFMPRSYGLVTFHRPSNVDDQEALTGLCHLLVEISEKAPLIFPIHPRTRKSFESNGLMSLLDSHEGIINLEPLSYVHFMNLLFNCRFAITDSGGIQEETTYLGIPCLTMRPNTERPITITHGTNQLCDLNNLEDKLDKVLADEICKNSEIEFWDGQTAARVVQSIKYKLNYHIK